MRSRGANATLRRRGWRRGRRGEKQAPWRRERLNESCQSTGQDRSHETTSHETNTHHALLGASTHIHARETAPSPSHAPPRTKVAHELQAERGAAASAVVVHSLPGLGTQARASQAQHKTKARQSQRRRAWESWSVAGCGAPNEMRFAWLLRCGVGLLLPLPRGPAGEPAGSAGGRVRARAPRGCPHACVVVTKLSLSNRLQTTPSAFGPYHPPERALL